MHIVATLAEKAAAARLPILIIGGNGGDRVWLPTNDFGCRFALPGEGPAGMG